MAYTLIGSQRSPFARTCRMLMLKHGLAFDFQVLNFVDDAKDAQILAQETPINKVPVLVDGDQKIFDSRVIVSYLAKKHGWPDLTLEEENMVSAIYASIDSSVTLFMLGRGGVDTTKGPFMLRQRERIPATLEYIMPWVETLDPKNPKHWNYPSMALFSYVHWNEVRAKILDLSRYPVVTTFMEKFGDMPEVKATGF